MKKRCLAAVICSCLFICLVFTKNNEYTHVVDSAKIPAFENVSEVISNSELVVKVKKVSDTPVAYKLAENHYDYLTLSTVEIIKVIQPMEGRTYSKGDRIQILESEWVDKDNKIIHHVSNYAKMKNNKSYVLCLGYNPSVDNFYPIGLLYGKLPVDKSENPFFGDVKDKSVQRVLKQMNEQFTE